MEERRLLRVYCHRRSDRLEEMPWELGSQRLREHEYML